MEKTFLVNTIKEVFVIVAKALKRAERFQTGRAVQYGSSGSRKAEDCKGQ